MPLIRSLWLAKKGKRSVSLRIVPKAELGRVEFEIVHGATERDVGEGTVRRGAATCPCCGYTTPITSVRAQLKAKRGGAADARLLAVVTAARSETHRLYRLPRDADFAAIRASAAELRRCAKSHVGNHSLIPDESTPMGGGKGAGRAFSQRIYGMERFGDLFTDRQLLNLTTLAGLVRSAAEQCQRDCDAGLATAVGSVLALCCSKLADLLNSLCAWQPSNDRATHLFVRKESK